MNNFSYMLTDSHIKKAEEAFVGAFAHLKKEFSKLQIGRANPDLIDGLLVDAYGGTQELRALGGISVTDARTLQIQPWDSHVLANIEKAISEAHLGLNPQNDGRVIRLVFPQLTEERRKELGKRVHQLAEEARVSVRTARQDAHGAFRELEKNKQITEDERRLSEKHLQEKVDKVNKDIEDAAKKKEEEIMTI